MYEWIGICVNAVSCGCIFNTFCENEAVNREAVKDLFHIEAILMKGFPALLGEAEEGSRNLVDERRLNRDLLCR